ncbi:MAG: hypothetical protein WCH30_00655 [Chlorobiaceae bacterium]
MDHRVSKSIIACTIDHSESAVIRLKTSGSDGYTLSGCKTVPHGLQSLASGKQNRLLTKLKGYCNAWKEKELALCVCTENLLPLPACFPEDATTEESREYCFIEAEHFLTRPDEYGCDIARYANDDATDNNKLLLFYPVEPCRKVAKYLSDEHQILFAGTAHLPLIHLSKFTEEPQVILELENSSVLLSISNHGEIEKLSFHQVKNHEEAEYFTMKELMENPICRQTPVQVTGTRADKAMMLLIGAETSCPLKPLGIPPSLSISNPQQLTISSPAVVKAISAAMMALELNKL